MKTFAYGIGVVTALAITLYPLTLSDDLVPTVYLVALALAAFLLALASNEWVLAGPGAALLIAAYAVALGDAPIVIDRAAPVVGIGALVLLETIDLVTLITRRPAPGRAVVIGHVGHAVVVVLAGAAVSAAVMLAAEVVGGGPAALAVPAALFGVLAIVIAVSLAQRAVEGDA